MAVVNTSVCVNYTPRQMFDLVNDVQAYPQYLPLCSAVKLLSKTPNSLKATITLAKGRIKFSFTTVNNMDEGRRINMNLVEGPFKFLHGFWTFESLPTGGCETNFQLEFEFSNALLGMAFGPFFKEVAESLVEAFCQQAAIRYGNSEVQPMEPIAP